MRTELKIKRLLTKHNPRPQFYEQYIGVEE